MSVSQVSIRSMLDDLLLDIETGALRHSQEFVKGLNDWFKKYNRLSDRQESALRKIYRNHIG